MGQESGKRPKFDVETKTPSKAPEALQDEHHVFNNVVGDGIRKARQEHGWTQAFLADQAGLSPNYIARLERGEMGIRPIKLFRHEVHGLSVPETGTLSRRLLTGGMHSLEAGRPRPPCEIS